MYDMMYNIMELFSPEGLIDITINWVMFKSMGLFLQKNLSMNQVSNCMIWIFMKFEWILWIWMFVWNQKQIMSITIIFIMFL